MVSQKLSKEEIVNYFKTLGDNNDNIGLAPNDCVCPFKEECSKCGAACLCDLIAHPEYY